MTYIEPAWPSCDVQAKHPQCRPANHHLCGPYGDSSSMSAPEAAVTYKLLWTAPNEASKVLLCETPHGSCVLKRWMRKRINIGGNRSQPLAEYAALLELQDLPHINAPLKLILDKQGVDFIYVHCGQNALQWRKQLVHEDVQDKDIAAERLAQRVAVHVLKALQEVHTRGYVHRDVKPTNILLRDYPNGGVWLSDMGLLTKSQQLSGFVKGLDLSYLVPEYITQSTTAPRQWQIIDDLVLLSSRTTGAVDLYQLGLTIFQLVTGSLPQPLLPPKNSSPKRFSAFLQKVASFNWQREIYRCISNPDIAQLLSVLLSNDPGLRSQPEELLRSSKWLQDYCSANDITSPQVPGQSWASSSSSSAFSPQQVQQQAAWAAEQQQALRAANYIEFLRLQEEFTAQLQGVAANSNPAASWLAGHSNLGRVGSYDSVPSHYDSCSTWSASPYTSPEPMQPTVCADDSFADIAVVDPALRVKPEDGWTSGATAASREDCW